MSSSVGTVGSTGNSPSWVKNKNNAIALFNKCFAEGENQDGTTFETMDEVKAAEFKVWEAFATFLALEYTISAGRSKDSFLKSSVSTSTLSTVMCAARDKFEPTGTDTTKLFFSCLNPSSGTNHAHWLRKLKLNMNRIDFERLKTAGTSMKDDAADPIYIEDVRRLHSSYALHGSEEAAERKMAIVAAHQAAGRSSEISWATLGGLRYDIHYNCLILEIPQPKVSKVKLVAIGAGIDRNCCFFTCLGDFLAMSRFVYDDDDETCWLFSCLRGTDSPGTKLGKFVKDVVKGGARRFESVAVDLSPALSAAGFRAGAVNALHTEMPIEHADASTGHSWVNISAFFEYLRPTISALMPGLVVLAGFPALPYGQSGKGPVPASLGALVSVGVGAVLLDKLTDCLFRLDSSSPRAFRPDGALRLAATAALASLIMHYDTRERKGEMKRVLALMRDAWTTVFRPGNGGAAADANRTLKEWSLLITTSFVRGNLHLTERESAGDSDRVVHSVQQLGAQFERLGREMSELKEVAAQSRESLNSVKRGLVALLRAFENRAETAGAGVTPVDRLVAPAAAADEEAEPASAQARAGVGGYDTSNALASLMEPPPPRPVALPVAPSSFLVLQRGGGGPISPVESIKNTLATEFYLKCMGRGGSLPALSASDRDVAKRTLEWYSAFATSEERALLQKPSPTATTAAEDMESAKRRVLKVLNDLVFERLSAAFKEKVELPKCFKGRTARQMKVGFIHARLRDLSQKSIPKVVADRTAFMQFRRHHYPSTLPASRPALATTPGPATATTPRTITATPRQPGQVAPATSTKSTRRRLSSGSGADEPTKRRRGGGGSS